MSNFFQIICKIGIFMICAQAVVHFRPQEAYEKYLKLLVSAMVLIQLFIPVSRILFHGDSEELAMKSQAFLEGLEAQISAAESKAFEQDALLEQMTLEEVRRRVEESQAVQSGEQQNIPDTTDNTVQIEKIQVEKIQVQLQTDFTEAISTE